MDPFTLANIGIQLYGAYSGKQQVQEEAGIQDRMSTSIYGELQKFPSMVQDVNKLYDQRLGILGQQRGASIYELLQKYNTQTAKSGFAGSGALDTQLQFETSSVYDLFAGKGFELLSQQQSQLSELAAQERSLRVQLAGLNQSGRQLSFSKYAESKGYASVQDVPTDERRRWLTNSLTPDNIGKYNA
jgi:hypothetical protein